jgi:hypothetical protein
MSDIVPGLPAGEWACSPHDDAYHRIGLPRRKPGGTTAAGCGHVMPTEAARHTCAEPPSTAKVCPDCRPLSSPLLSAPPAVFTRVVPALGRYSNN